VHEVLLMLEDTEDNDIESANTAILPPEVRADSDGDSDDEMVASKNPNSLSTLCLKKKTRHQTLAHNFRKC